MRILVTGGAGFIGSSVVRAYLALGHEVTVVDDLSTGRREYLPPEITFHQMDVASPALSDVVLPGRFEVISHHAAHVSVRESLEDPFHDARVNIFATINVLALAARHSVRKVIYPATVGAYGEPERLPVDEEHPLHPLSPYGVSKAAAEHYLLAYAHTAGFVGLSLRYANVYGPRSAAQGEGGVVAIFLDRMLRGQKPVIFGDGEQTRDFIHVDDIVRANVLALGYDRSNYFNISTGVETSVNTIFERLRAQTGYYGESRIEPAIPGEVRRIVLDHRKFTRALGWKPMVAIDDGLARTVDWARGHVALSGGAG